MFYIFFIFFSFFLLFSLLGRWLVAALQNIQRISVTAFSTENSENWFLGNRRKQAQYVTELKKNGDINKIQTKLFGKDKLPLRIESDENLKNRKIVSELDYYCALSPIDIIRISNKLDYENNENNDNYNDKNDHKIDEISNNKNEKNTKKSDISMTNLKNKISTMKNIVLNQINSPGSHYIDLKNSIKTRFVWFDYHKKCKYGNVQALKEIFPSVKKSIISDDGFFSCEILHENKNVRTDDKIVRDEDEMYGTYIDNNESTDIKIHVRNVQKNIVRTNCIDCLDRTNVVQTTIGRWALLFQLKSLDVVCGDGSEDMMTLPTKVRK